MVNEVWRQQRLLGVFLGFLADELQIPGWWQQRSCLWAVGAGLGAEAALRVSRKQLPHLYDRKKKPHHSETGKTPQLVNHLCPCHIYNSIFFLTILGGDISVKKLCFSPSAFARCLPVTSRQPILLPHHPFGQAAQPEWYCQDFSLMCVKMEQLEVLFQVFFGSVFDVT